MGAKTKDQLQADMAKLESERYTLQKHIQCNNLYSEISIMGIILAIENAFKVTLAKEPDRYSEPLACLATNLVTETKRITDIDLIGMTKGRLLEVKGFDEAMATAINQQLPVYALIANEVWGTNKRISSEDVQAFVDRWKKAEGGRPLG